MLSSTDGKMSSVIPKQYRFTHHYHFVARAHDAFVHTDTHDSDCCEKLYAIPKFDARTDTLRAQFLEYYLNLEHFHECSRLAMFAVYPPSDLLAWPLLYDQQQYIVACTHTTTAFSTLHCSGCCDDQHSIFDFDSADKLLADHACQHSYSDKQLFMHASNHCSARYHALTLMSSHSTDGNTKRTCADAAHGWIPSGECASVEPSTTATDGWIPSGECAGVTAHASSDYIDTGTRRPTQCQEEGYHGYSDHEAKSRGSSPGTSADAAHGWIPPGECASAEPRTSNAHGWIPPGDCAIDIANASSDHSNTVTRRPYQRQGGGRYRHCNHGVKSRGSIPEMCTEAAHGWIPHGECASAEPYTSAAHGWIPSRECATRIINASTNNSDTGSIRRRQQQEGGDHGHKDQATKENRQLVVPMHNLWPLGRHGIHHCSGHGDHVHGPSMQIGNRNHYIQNARNEKVFK